MFTYTRRRALRFRPPQASSDIADVREKEEVRKARYFLRRGLSRSTDESRRQHFGSQRCF